MSFARTKIQVPTPRAASLLARPVLQQRLAQAMLDTRLVLICAPAGFGKTVALSRAVQQLLQQQVAVAWVACDEGDLPVQLFECLVAALEPYDPPWRSAPEAMLRGAADAATPEQQRQIAAELINVLDACEVPHGVIVVDDLHRVRHPAVHEFLDMLLERLTPRWTLAIATRSEPPLALPRLRALGEVAEFGPAQLRFEADEARALAVAVGLPEDAGTRLHGRAQGWPAGLRLALNALRASPGLGHDGPMSAIDRHVFDFLATEVINRLQPELRDFLLTTSVLPELAASRCAALSGDPRAAAWLDDIEREGLFATRIDAAETTLRLHDLFREALESRLVREQPQRVRELLKRAAATEPDPLRRVAWLQRAEAWADAAAVLSEHGQTMLLQGQNQVVRQALDAFPPAERERSPGLQIVQAQLAWTRWDWALVIRSTALAAQLFDAAGQAAAARTARSYHCIALAGANRPETMATADALLADAALERESRVRALAARCWAGMRHDQRLVAPTLAEQLDLLEGIDDAARWYEASPLPPFVGLPGTREPLQRYLAGVQRRLPEMPTPLRGMCHALQGWLDLWRGDVAAAWHAQRLAADEARWLARPVNVDSYQRALQAVLHAVSGQAAAAREASDALVHDVEHSGVPMRVQIYLALYLHVAMRCAAIAEDWPRVAALAARAQAGEAGGMSWLSLPQQAGFGAFAAQAAGDLEEACARWRGLLAQESASDLYGQVAEARLRLADALLRRGRPVDEAVAVLLPLLPRVQASGEWGAVLMAGPGCLSRLETHDWQGRAPLELTDALRHWAGQARTLAGVDAGAATRSDRAVPPIARAPAMSVQPHVPAPSSARPPASEPLTPRELQVLQRIAEGDSNKHIARQFDRKRPANPS